MAVYVDDFNVKYRNMIMCHMMADSEEELDAMAEKIGVQRKWKQSPVGKRPAHFDICTSKKHQAIKLGAIPVTSRDMVKRFPTF